MPRAISLNHRPSIDGLGVKLWRFQLDNGRVLSIFERPESVAPEPYLLRLESASGEHIRSMLANFQGEATDRAQYLAYCQP